MERDARFKCCDFQHLDMLVIILSVKSTLHESAYCGTQFAIPSHGSDDQRRSLDPPKGPTSSDSLWAAQLTRYLPHSHFSAKLQDPTLSQLHSPRRTTCALLSSLLPASWQKGIQLLPLPETHLECGNRSAANHRSIIVSFHQLQLHIVSTLFHGFTLPIVNANHLVRTHSTLISETPLGLFRTE